MIKLLLALLLMASPVMAQAAPDAAELTKLLNDFLAGASRNDPAVHERFWADDLIYTRSAGRRVTKADIMRDLREAPAPKPDDPKTVYTAEDIRIQQYGNTAIVAFRLVATTDVEGAKQVQNLLNSGTFLKRNGKWQVVNWQSTRMPRSEEENRKDVAAAVAAFDQALLENNQKRLSTLVDRTFVWSSVKPAEFSKRDKTKEAISLYGETAVVRGEDYTMTLINQGGAWKIVSLFNR
jgi:ketosteroid isomerase-like protein